MNDGTVVYVVDDDTAVRESLVALLEAAETEARIECFAAGTDFLEACDPSANGCVLLDVRMPAMGGLEVQSRLQALESSLSVIVITGHGDVPMAVKAMRAGAFHFIEKPFSNDDLMEAVCGAIANSRATQKEQVSRREATECLDRLTARERDVLRHLVAGRLNKVIAYELGISARTVEVHRARVMEKLQVRSLSQAVRLALAAKAEDLVPS